MVQSVELKFNCFFLMPVVDSFPTKLREELESAYDDDIDEVFDVTAVRNALESRLKSLESELHQVSEAVFLIISVSCLFCLKCHVLIHSGVCSAKQMLDKNGVSHMHTRTLACYNYTANVLSSCAHVACMHKQHVSLSIDADAFVLHVWQPTAYSSLQ